MIQWTDTQDHVADNITLLCPAHHSEKSRGLLSLEEVRQANANPHNKAAITTPAYSLHYSGSSFQAVLGNVVFHTPVFAEGNRVSVLLIDGESQLGFRIEDGHLLMHFGLYDEHGHCIAVVDDNELVYATSIFDVEMVGPQLTFRSAHREVLLAMRFNSMEGVTIPTGRFLRNGIRVSVTASGIEYGPGFIASSYFVMLDGVGLALGQPEFMPAAMHFPDIEREGTWVLQDNGDMREVRDMVESDSGNLIEGEHVRIVDVVQGSENPVLNGWRFTNCYIEGPAVLAVPGSTFDQCIFPGPPEDLMYVLEASRDVYGVVVTQDCTFVGCTFGNIGFVGSRDFVESFSAGITAG